MHGELATVGVPIAEQKTSQVRELYGTLLLENYCWSTTAGSSVSFPWHIQRRDVILVHILVSLEGTTKGYSWWDMLLTVNEAKVDDKLV